MTKRILTVILIMVFAITTKAQNHPTIEKLSVSYKPDQLSQSIATIQCISQATITLKQNTGAVKLYFKIINPQDNSILYQINYSLSASPVTNNNGIKMFEYSNGVVKISSGQAITLKPYIYELQTEDNQNNLSTVFSKTN